MPPSDPWNAPPGQPCKETAARAALISLKKLSRSTARAQRPLPLAHAEVRDHADAVKRRLELAPHVRGGAQALARRCVCLCTRGTRRCARTDNNGVILPVPCPTLHTTEDNVCTSGQERRDTANLVSDFAHDKRRRVHKRTRNRPNRPPRVRLCTRVRVPCAQTDNNGAVLVRLCTRPLRSCANTDIEVPASAIWRHDVRMTPVRPALAY